MSDIKLLNANVLHFAKSHYSDENGTFYGETKLGHLAFMVRNHLVDEYGLSESRINPFKLESSFKKFGENAIAKSKKNGDFSDFFKMEQKCYQATVRNVKSNTWNNHITKEDRIAIKTAIKEVFNEYGVI